MARTLWLRWMAALCGGLVGGCLFHRPDGDQSDAKPAVTEPARVTASLPPADVPPDPPPPPPPLSPYAGRPPDVHVSASVEPMKGTVTLTAGGKAEASPKVEPPPPPPAAA